ncbi:MAG: Asp-tRNA(Asn)/Glu-tRNA(Gln) amidotransferase subunit GatC [Thermodesulfobacteriota bacterium]
MYITPDEVAGVAALARLELGPEETAAMSRQLDEILGYIAKLQEVDTSQVEVMTHTQNLNNVFREDQTVPSPPRQESLANAPRQNEEVFIVPRVI